MTNNQSDPEQSALAKANETVRHVAHEVRGALEDGQLPGQWKTIIGNLVREAPLASLGVAFVVGFLVARR